MAPGGSAEADLKELVAALEAEDFLVSVCEWAWKHCRGFPPHVDPEMLEHKHDWHDLHKEYRQLFEARAESFLSSREIKEEDFLEKVVPWLQDNAEASPVLHALTMSEDYTNFVRYMQRIHERIQWAEQGLFA
jgi:hypothetical protein